MASWRPSSSPSASKASFVPHLGCLSAGASSSKLAPAASKASYVTGRCRLGSPSSKFKHSACVATALNESESLERVGPASWGFSALRSMIGLRKVVGDSGPGPAAVPVPVPTSMTSASGQPQWSTSDEHLARLVSPYREPARARSQSPVLFYVRLLDPDAFRRRIPSLLTSTGIDILIL